MEVNKADREYARFKLAQAREALNDAQGLLADNAELSYVVNSLYYAFYYPALALLHAKGIPLAMQSVSIALFEGEFVKTGMIDQRFFHALRRLFELKPKCSTPQLHMVSRPEVETLLAEASGFIDTVERVVGDR
ncbi:MAG: hypothetical protein A2X58_00285 [Nitrospirae bacterium GWC2_56_14]|nr:MAG: hypothetical protein A2X58_00285 [Nitrospirae bacterium GWC2_56_14]